MQKRENEIQKMAVWSRDERHADRLRAAAIAAFAATPGPLLKGPLPKTPCVQTLSKGDRANVFVVRCTDGGAIAVKFFHDRRVATLMRNRLGRGKWRRIVEIAKTLEQRDVGHARVLGYAESGSRGAVLMDYLPAHESISAALRYSRGPQRWRLASALGRFTGRMHRAGVTHADFSLRNILAAEEKGRLDLRLSDIEDVRLHAGPAPFEAAIADLRHLAEQLPLAVSLGMRIRFLARYRRCAGLIGKKSLRELRKRFTLPEDDG